MRSALCLIIGLVLVSTAAFAMDLNPGTISMSGMSGLNFTKTTTSIEGLDDLESDYLSLEINGEYYIIKNLGIGLYVTYESEKEDIPGTDDRYECTSRMIGPMVVYNLSIAQNASIPVFASFGQAARDDGEEEYTGWAWAIGSGLHYFVTNHVSFDGYLVYDSISLEDGIEMDLSQIVGRVGVSIYLGGR